MYVLIYVALRRCAVSALSFSFICWIKEALNQSFILVVNISSLVWLISGENGLFFKKMKSQLYVYTL